jgi:hypothetical protein
MASLKILKVYPNEPAALVAQAILRGGGVESVLRLNTAGGMEPQLQFVGGVPLLVAEADLAAAVELLADDPGTEADSRT